MQIVRNAKKIILDKLSQLPTLDIGRFSLGRPVLPIKFKCRTRPVWNLKLWNEGTLIRIVFLCGEFGEFEGVIGITIILLACGTILLSFQAAFNLTFEKSECRLLWIKQRQFYWEFTIVCFNLENSTAGSSTFLAISHPQATLVYPGQPDFDLLQSVTPPDTSETVTQFSAHPSSPWPFLMYLYDMIKNESND